MKCVVCDHIATANCARCKRRPYCTRECQRADWQTHKTSCGQKLFDDTPSTDQTLLVLASNVTKPIMGNIQVIAHHNKCDRVEVIIAETVDHYLANIMHLVNINACGRQAGEQIDICQIIDCKIIFDDFTLSARIPYVNADTLPNPGSTITILFESEQLHT